MAVAGFSCSCGPSRYETFENGSLEVDGLIPDLVRVREERRKGPPPESEWNDKGIWKQVEEDPPTYVPEGYPDDAPRTDSEGKWFHDERDGKRIFVPSRSVGGYSAGTLRGEASKVTDWVYTKEKAWAESWVE